MVAQLGISEPRQPVLAVVGSKGKGTIATYASAYLVAAGKHVVTVTSPGLRGVRDRIRFDGRSVSDAELGRLGRRVCEAYRQLPEYRSGDGYLSPSGLFIVAGVLYAQQKSSDIIVLEAGMGGVSDEISLFPPKVLAIAKIFGEHIGVLGDTPAEIARNKAGIVTADTRAVVSLPQGEDVSGALEETVATCSGKSVAVDFSPRGASGVPPALLAPSLGRDNSEIGCVAAQRMLNVCNYAPPSTEQVWKLLGSVTLPGRWSWHDIPRAGIQLFVDAAISRAGVAAALTEVLKRWGAVDHVLLCMPDHKDIDGAIVELGDMPVTYVRLTDKPRLTFSHSVPSAWETVDVAEINVRFLQDRGRRIAVLGTGYFVARMLALADVDTERLFTP